MLLAEVSLGAAPNFILDKATLEVPRGARVAVVGATGSGTSAILDLLHGDWDAAPPRGAILLDGLDLRSWRKSRLRARVGLVRSGMCFGGSVADNVSAGRAGVGAAEVQQALEAVGLWSMIAALPEGQQLLLRSDGAPLSHGQRVLVSLARALTQRPALLLVDDLALLDAEARERVLALVLGRGLAATVFIATSDPDIVARCDWTLRTRQREGLATP